MASRTERIHAVAVVRWGLAVCAGGLLAAGMAGGELTAEQQKAYGEVRKGLFVAMALPPAQDQQPLRKEHRQYLRTVERFLKDLGPGDAAYRAAGLYHRGRLLVHLRSLAEARKGLDACLAAAEQVPADDRPPGLPSTTAIRILRALSFLPDGVPAVITELEAIPADAPKPAVHEVGDVLTRLADRLEQKADFANAIRVLEVVKRFGLWEEEFENPQKKIDLLKLGMSGGATADGGAK